MRIVYKKIYENPDQPFVFDEENNIYVEQPYEEELYEFLFWGDQYDILELSSPMVEGGTYQGVGQRKSAICRNLKTNQYQEIPPSVLWEKPVGKQPKEK